MKYKVLRMLATSRRYANTEKGEKVIVRILTTITAIGIVDMVLFIIGSV